MANYSWSNPNAIGSREYTCGFCGSLLVSNQGWSGSSIPMKTECFIYICHLCGGPTLIDPARKLQIPGVAFGHAVHDIPDESVRQLYEEARNATGAGSHTAAVLCCRKLLMHVAVSKGAEEEKSFLYYLKYLADNHYFPPDAKEWVDHIRGKSNEADYEIVIAPPEEAEELLSFIEMLLKMVYESPATIKMKR